MLRILALMFSRRWLLTTLLVFAGAGLCVRLGIWQLDRLAQRRAFNAHVIAMRALPTVDLTSGPSVDLTTMEFRSVQVKGEYDFDNQVALRNQYDESQLGYHLLTPLIPDQGTAVFVDRGWIPADDNPSPSDWRRYDQAGELTISGILRLGQARPELGLLTDPTLDPSLVKLDFWNMPDLERIAQQVSYPLLAILIQPDVDPLDNEPPIPYQPEIELTEGPHLGYAGQWFIFAAMLFFGYPFFYLRKQETVR